MGFEDQAQPLGVPRVLRPAARVGTHSLHRDLAPEAALVSRHRATIPQAMTGRPGHRGRWLLRPSAVGNGRRGRRLLLFGRLCTATKQIAKQVTVEETANVGAPEAVVVGKQQVEQL